MTSNHEIKYIQVITYASNVKPLIWSQNNIGLQQMHMEPLRKWCVGCVAPLSCVDTVSVCKALGHELLTTVTRIYFIQI